MSEKAEKYGQMQDACYLAKRNLSEAMFRVRDTQLELAKALAEDGYFECLSVNHGMVRKLVRHLEDYPERRLRASGKVKAA